MKDKSLNCSSQLNSLRARLKTRKTCSSFPRESNLFRGYKNIVRNALFTLRSSRYYRPVFLNKNVTSKSLNCRLMRDTGRNTREQQVLRDNLLNLLWMLPALYNKKNLGKVVTPSF